MITFSLAQLKSLFFTEFKHCDKIIPESNDVQLTKLINFIQLETLKMHLEVN